DVEKWMHNYYAKLDFVDAELANRSLAWQVEKSHILWAHDHRNEQYHGGHKGTPEKRVLEIIRKAVACPPKTGPLETGTSRVDSPRQGARDEREPVHGRADRPGRQVGRGRPAGRRCLPAGRGL